MPKLDYAERRVFARDAAPGDYFAKYEDTSAPDPGNRCGYSDDELDDIERRLRERGLTLETDDVGLVVRTVRR